MQKPSKEEFDLVIEAIRYEYKNNPITLSPAPTILNMAESFASKKDREGIHIQLDIAKHAELKNIPQKNVESIIWALEVVDKILKNYSPRTLIPYEKPHTIPASVQNDPLRYSLVIYESFDNWYAAYILKRESKLENLNRLNLEKIYNLVLDIDDKFQLNPSQMITITTSSPNYNRFPLLRNKVIGNFKVKLDFRIDALNFLKDINLIYHYEINDSGDIEIALDVEQFAKFKEEIAKIYEEKHKQETPVPPIAKTAPETTQESIKKPKDEVVYEIKYTAARELILNNFLLSKVNFNSENDNVFGYIYGNPNRIINIEELKKPAGGKLTKDLHKIIENLGFEGELKKAFFNISKNDIFFRNPLIQKDLDDLGISRLRLPK